MQHYIPPPTMMRSFQVQAFLPKIGDEEQSPVRGLGSIYANIDALTLEEAMSKFYELELIRVNIGGLTETVVFVNPRMCPVIAVQDVTELLAAERKERLEHDAVAIDTQTKPTNLLSEAHFKLKRVK